MRQIVVEELMARNFLKLIKHIEPNIYKAT